ncbi:hypothetical protein IP91_02560 [Pseudoduganella lurida]|uniref:CAAX prenyl protease 2/Lysostaphin resistance protein A-like domain-containing protein n=1 Tax=Pseudoduganella lurida TaxID=1036180 RepID=A0A562R9A2_9BURK|nr:CAAX prenyl protease-related protein [Pseudoduganella lurida]TWI65154.1 hypothetical protein IP91_02560 [Pseudoduganella lurida]
MTAQQHKRPATGADAASGARDPIGIFRRPSSGRILPFAVYMAFIAVADGLVRLGWTAETLRWVYPVKIVAVVLVLLAYRKSYAELAWHPLSLRRWCSVVAVGGGVLLLWINLDAGWMQIGTSAGFDPTGGTPRMDWLLVACRIAGAALVVPLMEELFWRSFLMRWLEERNFLQVYPARVGLQSLIGTVVLFGFEHNLWLAGIVAGVAYSLLYMRTGNLWTAIIAHAVTNGLLGAWIMVTSSWTYW